MDELTTLIRDTETMEKVYREFLDVAEARDDEKEVGYYSGKIDAMKTFRKSLNAIRY